MNDVFNEDLFLQSIEEKDSSVFVQMRDGLYERLRERKAVSLDDLLGYDGHRTFTDTDFIAALKDLDRDLDLYNKAREGSYQMTVSGVMDKEVEDRLSERICEFYDVFRGTGYPMRYYDGDGPLDPMSVSSDLFLPFDDPKLGMAMTGIEADIRNSIEALEKESISELDRSMKRYHGGESIKAEGFLRFDEVLPRVALAGRVVTSGHLDYINAFVQDEFLDRTGQQQALWERLEEKAMTASYRLDKIQAARDRYPDYPEHHSADDELYDYFSDVLEEYGTDGGTDDLERDIDQFDKAVLEADFKTQDTIFFERVYATEHYFREHPENIEKMVIAGLDGKVKAPYVLSDKTAQMLGEAYRDYTMVRMYMEGASLGLEGDPNRLIEKAKKTDESRRGAFTYASDGNGRSAMEHYESTRREYLQNGFNFDFTRDVEAAGASHGEKVKKSLPEDVKKVQDAVVKEEDAVKKRVPNGSEQFQFDEHGNVIKKGSKQNGFAES